MSDFLEDNIVPKDPETASNGTGKYPVHTTDRLRFGVIGFLILMGSGIIALAIFIPLNWNMDPCIGNSNFGRQTETSGMYKSAAVSADSSICSSLGTRVLIEGGNAVDASIVTVLCSGIQNFQSCGIGGGSFMMINDEKNNIRQFINCREKAPANADKGMGLSRIILVLFVINLCSLRD